jgi:hypothetical protein
MKLLLNLSFVCLVLLWGPTVLADPPNWVEFPYECTAEHGVCFQAFIGEEIWVYGADPVSGAYAEATFIADSNDFVRQNPDGTYFCNWAVRELTSGFYCPPGSSIPDECLPIDLSYPSHFSQVGLITILPDPPGFWFSPSCPLAGNAIFYVTDSMGDLHKVSFSGVFVKSPEGDCKPIRSCFSNPSKRQGHYWLCLFILYPTYWGTYFE